MTRSPALCLSLSALLLSFCLQIPPTCLPGASAMATSPVKWVGYPQNPVMKGGPPGSWDRYFIKVNQVILEEGTYKLFYSGQANESPPERIGYATSPDGITWSKHAANPIIVPGPPGSWDGLSTTDPTVVKDGSSYKMWYAGSNGNTWRIGYATSVNGVSWTKYAGNPVMDCLISSDWESSRIAPCCVFKEHGEYRMWYSGSDGTHSQIGYASSTDGARWTRYDGNPVVRRGEGTSWDGDSSGHCTVISRPGGYKMWFEGNGRQIGFATSPDGLSWTEYGGNPVIGAQGTGWDGYSKTAPAVIFNGTGYQMWYTAVDCSTNPSAYSTGYAEGLDPGLQPPLLEYPANGDWTNDSRPVFRWSFRNGGDKDLQAGYRLQLAGTGAFAEIQYDSQEVVSGNGSHVPASALQDGLHYWRVRAWTGEDGCSDWSLPWVVRMDTVLPKTSISPLPSNVSGPEFRVNWSGSDGGSGIDTYDVQFSNSSGPWTDWLLDTNRTGANFRGQPGCSYSFRARARDLAGNMGNYSSEATISVEAGSPNPSPSPGYPENDSWTNDNTPEFGWSFVSPGAGAVQAAYQLQISPGSDFGRMEYDSLRVDSSAPAHSPASSIPDGDHFWRVRTWTAELDPSGWSETRLIRIDTIPPTASLTSLVPDSRSPTVVVNWSGSDSASGVESYDVQTLDSGGKWSFWIKDTPLTNQSYSGQDGQNCSFRVRAQDRAGNVGNYSAPADIRLRIDNPGPTVSIQRPVANSTIKGRYEATGVSGHALAGRRVELVEVSLDGGPWETAGGTLSWSFPIDCDALAGGAHTLRARAFDGSKYSGEAVTRFNVKKGSGEISVEAFPWLPAVLVVIAAAIGLALYLKGRQGRGRRN